jgi:hypothetical protein
MLSHILSIDIRFDLLVWYIDRYVDSRLSVSVSLYYALYHSTSLTCCVVACHGLEGAHGETMASDQGRERLSLVFREEIPGQWRQAGSAQFRKIVRVIRRAAHDFAN